MTSNEGVLPTRRNSLRLQGHDYSLPGCYFFTIVTQGRVCRFGEVKDGEIVHNAVGKMVETVFQQMLTAFPGLMDVAHVVMPNHVHLLLSPIGDDEVVKSIGSVKQFSANAINKRLGRRGNVWQRNVFDRLVRDIQGFEACVNYINQNPCNLRPDQYTIGGNASSVAIGAGASSVR